MWVQVFGNDRPEAKIRSISTQLLTSGQAGVDEERREMGLKSKVSRCN